MTNDTGSLINYESFCSGLIHLLKSSLKDELLSVYLSGSYVSGFAIPSSDIDFVIVARGALDADRRKEIVLLRHSLCLIGGRMIDLVILDENELRHGIMPHVKTSRLIYGVPMFKTCSLMPMPDIITHYAKSVFYFMGIIRGKDEPFRCPLVYPDPDGAFLGYDKNGYQFAPMRYSPGFHMLVNLALSIASFRLAALTKVHFSSKHSTAIKYTEHLPGDELGKYIKDLYAICRGRLERSIPTDPAEQLVLKSYCAQMLPFENNFLALFDSIVPGMLPKVSPYTAELLRALQKKRG